MIQRIDRYMARQIITPLLVTLAVAAMLLLLERMLRIFDMVVNQGGPFLVVWEMLASLMPHYVSVALPLGLFLGVLLAFRKLSLNNEIDALQSVGVGLPRLMWVAVSLAVLLTLVNFALLNYVQPYTRYNFRSLEFELRSGAFGASIRVGEYNRVTEDLTIRVAESRQGGQRLEGIFVHHEQGPNRVTAITGREGTVMNTGDGRTLLLRLYDGILVNIDPRRPTPTVLQFKMHDWPVVLPETEAFRRRGGGHREMTFGELWNAVRTPRATREWQAEWAAFHARLVYPLSILAMPFLATPFGFMTKRTGRAFGLTVGVIILVVYQKVLEFGEAYAALGEASPWLTMWLPFALFAAGAGYLYWRSVFTVGANPFAWLEAFWDGLTALYYRLFPPMTEARE